MLIQLYLLCSICIQAARSTHKCKGQMYTATHVTPPPHTHTHEVYTQVDLYWNDDIKSAHRLYMYTVYKCTALACFLTTDVEGCAVALVDGCAVLVECVVCNEAIGF